MNENIQILLATHSRLVAEMQMARACADRDTARDGWTCDYTEWFNKSNNDAVAMEAEIAKILENKKS